MSTKTVIASFVVELTESESGFRSITVTPQGPYAGFSAPLVTETYWDISGTIQRL